VLTRTREPAVHHRERDEQQHERGGEERDGARLADPAIKRVGIARPTTELSHVIHRVRVASRESPYTSSAGTATDALSTRTPTPMANKPQSRCIVRVVPRDRLTEADEMSGNVEMDPYVERTSLRRAAARLAN
jgi:hypothetical protein